MLNEYDNAATTTAAVLLQSVRLVTKPMHASMVKIVQRAKLSYTTKECRTALRCEQRGNLNGSTTTTSIRMPQNNTTQSARSPISIFYSLFRRNESSSIHKAQQINIYINYFCWDGGGWGGGSPLDKHRRPCRTYVESSTSHLLGCFHPSHLKKKTNHLGPS